jgi:serine/threonine protein kinase
MATVLDPDSCSRVFQDGLSVWRPSFGSNSIKELLGDAREDAISEGGIGRILNKAMGDIRPSDRPERKNAGDAIGREVQHSPRETGRNLLFGVLALQNNFIGRDDLVSAFTTWYADKSCPLAQVLVDCGALDAPRRVLLEALMSEFLKQHGSDPAPSLAALSSIGSVRDELSRVGAADVQATLAEAASDLHDNLGLVRDELSRVGAADVQATLAEAASDLHDNQSDIKSRFDDYELMELLGSGGMGVVYKARQVSLDRRVALKVIRSHRLASPDEHRRFFMEARVVATLNHPNIVPIYEIGMHDGMPYFSMMLLEGGRLSDRTHQGPLNPREVAGLMATVARAVHAAHQCGILHRDLKPSNILFNDHGIPYVTDFGLAKRVDSDDSQTATGQIMGSPSYMAPEQARGHSRDVGLAADVYALGAILYELLTGRPPFRGASIMETLDLVRNQDPVPPSRLVPRLRRDLETICLKCLEKDPRKRYDTASEVADDLERFLNGDPIKARSTRWWERGAKWARLRPVAALLAAMMVLTCSMSMVLSVKYNGISLRHELSRTRAELDVARRDLNALKAMQASSRGREEAARKLLEDAIDNCDALSLSCWGVPEQEMRLAELHARLERARNALGAKPE